MRPTRVVLPSVLLAGCGSGSMILWNPRTGLCDEVPTVAAYNPGRGALRHDPGRRPVALCGAEGREPGADREAEGDRSQARPKPWRRMNGPKLCRSGTEYCRALSSDQP